MSLNHIWWNWPHIVGCHLTNIKDPKQPKCSVDIATISQKLDIMSDLNLIYSNTQVCSLNCSTYQIVFYKYCVVFMHFRVTIS